MTITVLKFEAKWCGPCQAIQPIWEELQKDTSNIYKAIDIDDNPQLRADYHVRTIPLFIAIKDGKEVARKQGAATVRELKDWLDEQRDLQPDVLQEQS